MRTHTQLFFQTMLTDTAPVVNFGLVVSSAPATGAPNPAADFGDDWMLLQSKAPYTEMDHILSPSTGTPTAILWGHEIDNRSKRRIEELGEKYYLSINNGGTSAITISSFTRTLLALP